MTVLIDENNKGNGPRDSGVKKNDQRPGQAIFESLGSKAVEDGG